jgi:hypothetical protein
MSYMMLAFALKKTGNLGALRECYAMAAEVSEDDGERQHWLREAQQAS